MEGRYAIVDVETTGFSPREDRVVEVACVVLDGALREVAAFSSLVDPGRAIPHYATAVHGIRDRDVAGAPALASLRGRLRALTAGTTVVAHNASFDRRFLDCLDDREWLCTLKLPRRPRSATNSCAAIWASTIRACARSPRTALMPTQS